MLTLCVKAGGRLKTDTSERLPPTTVVVVTPDSAPSVARLLLGVERLALDRAHVVWTPLAHARARASLPSEASEK